MLHVALPAACSPKGKATLRLYDEVLGTIMSKLGLAPPAVKDDAYGDAFLNLVFIPELDENADGQVTRDELLSVQMKAERYNKLTSKDAAQPALRGWPDLLEAILRGFDRESLVQAAPKTVLSSLDHKMQVCVPQLIAIGGPCKCCINADVLSLIWSNKGAIMISAFWQEAQVAPGNTYYS